MTNIDDLLMIFVKNPLKGKVKTRLAKEIGDTEALAIYKRLLQKTHDVTTSLPCAKKVYYNSFVDTDDIWENEKYEKTLQHPGSLGIKMSSAFEESLKKYHKVLIIGSDCDEITSEIIEEAFEKLNDHDIVIGPSSDGGYYLLGMKSFFASIFKNKIYSTDKVFDEAMEEIANLGKSSYLLPELNDIDVVSDLKKSRLRRKLFKKKFKLSF